MRYVTFDANGELLGAFIQELQPADSDRYIEIFDDAVYQNWTAYRANAARDGLELAPVGPVPTTVPQEVRADQFALAAIDAGLWLGIEAYFADLPDDAAGARARVRFQRSPAVRRTCDLVATVAAALSKTGAEVDALFIAAAALNP
nr:hypothetical protein [uncultured Duganella sp.]